MEEEGLGGHVAAARRVEAPERCILGSLVLRRARPRPSMHWELGAEVQINLQREREREREEREGWHLF